MKPLVLALTFLSALLAWPGVSLAAKEKIFALIATNNRSLASHRPDLHYADDDGARYYRVLRMLAPAKQVVLLTDFDHSSKRLYPDLVRVARKPRLDEVQKAIASLTRQIQVAKGQGYRTVFYFIFAGHGDVHQGKGYLELEDGKLGPDALESKIIAPVNADVVHLVLDSCNSFFVVNPRKPGGRRWATPKDMTKGFSKRHPNVGVFLSTSSEAEVYEWSELQSGIFSHEVRSGLSGAADINSDGRVSYSELESFVTVANREIRNENYRPKVFARGPWNQGTSTLFTHRWAKGRRLVVDDQERRLWIRDEQGTRLVDLHKERGTQLQLTLPVADDKELYVQEQVADKKRDGRPAIRQFVVSPSAEKILLASLEPAPLPVSGRGHSRVFGQLFAGAHGPRSHQKHLAESKKHRKMVFGISKRDTNRMRHHLSSISGYSRDRRHYAAIAGISIFSLSGVLGGLYGAGVLGSGHYSTVDQIGGYTTMGLSALFTALNVVILKYGRSMGEMAYYTFERQIAKPGASQDEVVAKTEVYLRKLAEGEKNYRLNAMISGYSLGGTFLAGTVALGVFDIIKEENDRNQMLLLFGMGAAGAALLSWAMYSQFSKSPVQRMLDLYHQDPDLKMQLSVGPVSEGMALGIRGTF